MIRPHAIGILILVAPGLFGQEQFGMAHSNYAGTDAVPLNPARMATQWSWMDVNIAGADAFVWNDHVYISGRERTVLGEMRESIRTADGDRFDFYESLKPGGRAAFVNARIAAPAVALNLGRSSVGAHISARAAVSLTGVGYELARFGYNGLGYRPQHAIRYDDDRLRLMGAAWTEFGASYARLLVARDNTLISAGLTAKYLLAHAGMGIGLDRLAYTVQDTARLVVHEASGRYGIATPGINTGTGFGIDIGAVYERTLESADGYVPHGSCDRMPYRFRLGVSLIDLGGMRFRQGMSGTFEGSSADIPDYTDIQVSGEEGVDSLLASSLTTFSRTTGFKMGLPTAIAVQYDQRIAEHVYMAADVVQNLAFGDQLRLRRPNSIALVPRFELQRFEAAVPLVVHEYDLSRPTLGLMLRLNSVVLGSDDLLSLLGRRGLFSTDVYVRIKWTIFRSPACRGKKSRTHRAGDRAALPCSFPDQ